MKIGWIAVGLGVAGGIAHVRSCLEVGEGAAGRPPVYALFLVYLVCCLPWLVL